MAGINMPTHPLIGNLAVPLAISMFLIAVEPDSVYFKGYDTRHNLDSMYGANSDSVVIDDYATDSSRAVITNERGFFRKDKLARPYLWAAGSIVAGVGTYLLEKVVGEKLRLDEITLEVEYCGSPFKENPDVEGYGMPEPVTITDQTFVPPANEKMPTFDQSAQKIDSKDWHKDDFRWALMFSKSFAERFSVNGKIASDHFRQRDAWGFYSNIERVFAYYEWYWEMGISVNF
jgi:hypothetical protein